jgi:hypothetical protein
MRVRLSRLVEAARAEPLVFRVAWPWRERPYFNRRVVRPGDDLVVEGFPRSANTFALAVLRSTQDPALEIANHFHSPAQFRLAARYGVPALLLVRRPADAVLSAMIYEGTADPRPLLRRYRRFHAPLVDLAPYLVVADFATVTSDFGRVVAALNDRFECGLVPVAHDQDLVRRARSWLEAHDGRRARRAGVTVGERRVALPHPEREARKAALRARLAAPAVARELAAACTVYERLRRAAA